MKKLIAYFLVLAMCFGLAGCANEPEEPVNPDPAPVDPAPAPVDPAPAPVDPAPAPVDPAPTAEDYLADAKAYVFNMYKDKAGKVLRDFDLVASVKIDSFSYDIAWTTDAAEDQVKLGAPANNKVTVDLNEKPGEEDLVFTLTATLTAGSKTETTSFQYYVPGTPAKTGGPVFVEVPEVGTAYKYALTQANLGKVLYFTGAMSGNYLATSADPTQAVDVTVEEVEGGYRLFFMADGVKTYIDIHEYTEGKAGVRLTAEDPYAVFTWNEECKVYTAVVAGAERYLGTYSTYNTISASEIKYIAGDKQADVGVSQFPAGFCNVEFKMDKVSGQPAAGTTAKFYLTQANLGKNLYFAGSMSGNYLATTTNPMAAPDVTIEEVEGGFRLFFMADGVKTYIDIHEYTEGKAGVRLTAEDPYAVFTWNEECGVFTAVVAGAERYLGTYSTYNTISASEIKYIAGDKLGDIGISQFPCFFGTMAYEFTAVEGQPAEGTTAKYALTQANLGANLYFAGSMSGNYLATTTNPAAAPDVTIEAVEGGFRFYFMADGVKTYIDIHEYTEGKAGVRLTAEDPYAVFTWNEECGVFTAVVAGAERYLGTYSTYNTISASEIKYIAGDKLGDIGISQFPCFFGTAAPAI